MDGLEDNEAWEVVDCATTRLPFLDDQVPALHSRNVFATWVSKWLYRMDRTKAYRHIEPLFKGVINQELITNAWDDLMRVAGSLKRGKAVQSHLGFRMV